MRLINCPNCPEQLQVKDGFVLQKVRRPDRETLGALCYSCGWIGYGRMEGDTFVIEEEDLTLHHVPGVERTQGVTE